MKLLDIGALQQSSQGLSGPKGSGAASASGLFKQLLSGAGAQSGLVNAETAGATLSINDAMQIIEKWMQSPEEGINGDLLSALQTLQGQTLDSSDLKSLEELFQKMESSIYGDQMDKSASEHSEQLIQVHFFIYQLLNQQPLSFDAKLVQDIEAKGQDFIHFLSKNGVDEKLIQQVKEQFFSQGSAPKLNSMSQSELKHFNQLIDHMMANAKGSDKELKIALGELKELVSPRQESTLATPAKGANSLEWLIKKEVVKGQSTAAPASEKTITHTLLPGHKQFFQLQSAAPVQQTQTTDEKPGTVDQQILNTWKQMKFTPFGNSSGRFTVRLNPENLGFITIQLTKQNGMYASKITASTQAAKELLEHHLPQLKQALPNMSVQVDRFHIPLQSNEQPLFGQQFNEENKQQQSKGQNSQQTDEQEAEFQDVLDALVGSDEEEEEI
ncbi:flagellar hook-length control protein FliK [Bacillus pumilus]|uniref:flagellar hook-length control protein FliK n=1 Tax=Bacillus TaxID=1386 RepID=UPI000680697C|nr:flagellar hook-length control protein FliK [Bacillus pumilus]MBR0590003.1 flagellar hook-length control protein FliK [Bacillus pumilus sxm20-2]KMY19695.1 flagellar hook-length control protein [Bacillus pumilus]MCI4616857.1 flagellar hook-length control protein FliK [Bacillus pumilus]MCY7434736.1 flagellar hook-length control protein FliK [Bacillus pumilus]MDR7249343.1 flagellar hook-length control protein FliK [Bacillus pumilus]